jgi:hypothetical protein
MDLPEFLVSEISIERRSHAILSIITRRPIANNELIKLVDIIQVHK